MAVKVNGLTEQWNHKFILGYTDTETVMLDFDNTPLKDVKYWSRRIMQRFKLEGFTISESSENNYHVVFNRKVSWSENVGIVAWASLHSNNRPHACMLKFNPHTPLFGKMTEEKAMARAHAICHCFSC